MVGFEGEEKFGTCKQGFRTPLGFIGDSHQSNQDNFFVLRQHAPMFHDSHASIIFTM
jgi:hypothetical protein